MIGRCQPSPHDFFRSRLPLIPQAPILDAQLSPGIRRRNIFQARSGRRSKYATHFGTASYNRALGPGSPSDAQHVFPLTSSPPAAPNGQKGGLPFPDAGSQRRANSPTWRPITSPPSPPARAKELSPGPRDSPWQPCPQLAPCPTPSVTQLLTAVKVSSSVVTESLVLLPTAVGRGWWSPCRKAAGCGGPRVATWPEIVPRGCG
jgi:hypothetical protein